MLNFYEIIDKEVTLDNMKRKRGRGKWNRHDPDVIPLDYACPDYPVPPEIEDAAIQAIKDGCWGYAWFPETFEAIAETVRTKYKIKATIDDIKITPSTEPTLSIPALIACKPGDEIILQSTIYTTFIDVIDYVSAKSIYLDIKQEDNWKIDIDSLNELVTKRTRVIYLCNPNNPVGRVMTKKELSGIADIAVDNNLIVGIDEIHSDIIFDGRKHISIASLGPEIADRTITMMGLSKTFGLAGLKIGWFVATNKEIMDKCKKVTQCLLKVNTLGTNKSVRGISTISLAVAHAVLTKCNEYIPPLVEYIQEVRDYGMKRLSKINNIKINPPEGTYVFWPNFSSYGLSSTEMSDYLIEKARVAIDDGSHYGPGAEGFLRIVFSTSKAILKEAIDRIEEALSIL